jgi:hypothetical protein
VNHDADLHFRGNRRERGDLVGRALCGVNTGPGFVSRVPHISLSSAAHLSLRLAQSLHYDRLQILLLQAEQLIRKGRFPCPIWLLDSEQGYCHLLAVIVSVLVPVEMLPQKRFAVDEFYIQTLIRDGLHRVQKLQLRDADTLHEQNLVRRLCLV